MLGEADDMEREKFESIAEVKLFVESEGKESDILEWTGTEEMG